MPSIFDISTKNLVRWSALLSVFEILNFIRYFGMHEPITKVCPMLGPNPDSYMINAYFLFIGVLAYIRAAFCIRPANKGIAKFAYQAHILELVPVTYLYWVNIISPITSLESFMVQPSQLFAQIFVYGIIVSNAIIFSRFYDRVSQGYVISREGSVTSRANSVSVARGNSVDAVVVPSPPMPAPAKKKTTKTSSSSRKSV